MLTKKLLASKLQISMQRLANLSIELFGESLKEFDSEQEQQITAALVASSADNVQDVKSLISAVQTQANQSLANSPVNGLSQSLTVTSSPEKLAKIKDIVGNRVISRNTQHWLKVFQLQLSEALALQDKMLTAFTLKSQQNYQSTFTGLTADLRDSMQQMRRINSEMLQEFFNSEKANYQAAVEFLDSVEMSTQAVSQIDEKMRQAIDELMNLG